MNLSSLLRRLRPRSMWPLCVLAIGCTETAPAEYADPAGRRAHVEVLAETSAGIAKAPDCGLVLAGGLGYDADGAPHRLAGLGESRIELVGVLDLDDDGVGDLVEAAQDGAIAWRRASTPCAWGTSEPIGGPHRGIARGADFDGTTLRVGWSDSDVAARAFAREGATWREAPVDEPPGLQVRRTWFVRSWRGRVLFGLDAAEGWTVPPIPSDVEWARADPMGSTELHVAGRRMLFVSGLPTRSLLLDEACADHAEEAGVRGSALRVTWQSAVTDLDSDGRDDVIALAMAGHNASDGAPASPRVLMQIDGGRFASLPVDGTRLWSTWIACVGGLCAASGTGGAALVRITLSAEAR